MSDGGQQPGPWCEHVVYVDESGDHSLVKIDETYPVFVLACCVFAKESYRTQVVPDLLDLKFKTFGHDMFVLHERDIRLGRGDFASLNNKERKLAFMQKLSGVVERAPFTLIAAVIDKRRFKAERGAEANPYHYALRFCLERIHLHLRHNANSPTCHVICEARGAKEDNDLELAFRRICDGDNYNSLQLPFAVHFASKQCNSTGLQLADLIARPIGRHVLQPDQPNQAYDLLKSKFVRSPRGKLEGWGLKCYP